MLNDVKPMGEKLFDAQLFLAKIARCTGFWPKLLDAQVFRPKARGWVRLVWGLVEGRVGSEGEGCYQQHTGGCITMHINAWTQWAVLQENVTKKWERIESWHSTCTQPYQGWYQQHTVLQHTSMHRVGGFLYSFSESQNRIRLALSRHCQVEVLHIRHTLSRDRIHIYGPPNATTGRVCGNMGGHAYAGNSVLVVFADHLPVQLC